MPIYVVYTQPDETSTCVPSSSTAHPPLPLQCLASQCHGRKTAPLPRMRNSANFGSSSWTTRNDAEKVHPEPPWLPSVRARHCSAQEPLLSPTPPAKLPCPRGMAHQCNMQRCMCGSKPSHFSTVFSAAIRTFEYNSALPSKQPRNPLNMRTLLPHSLSDSRTLTAILYVGPTHTFKQACMRRPMLIALPLKCIPTHTRGHNYIHSCTQNPPVHVKGRFGAKASLRKREPTTHLGHRSAPCCAQFENTQMLLKPSVTSS